MSSQDGSPQLLKFCRRCRENRPLTNFRQNGRHTKKNTGEVIIYREDICSRCRRRARIQAGLCSLCNSDTQAVPGHTACKKHLQLYRDSANRRNRRDKDTALTKYGGQCKYCGDSRRIFLTIDHINNDRAAHRKQPRAGQNHGHNIYAWLRLNHYPDGFQILCYNCNCAKNHAGEEEVLRVTRENPHTTSDQLVTDA